MKTHGTLERIARTPAGLIGLVLTLFVLVVVILGPVIAPYSPSQVAGLPAEGPSSTFWLGTDTLGRDVLTRTLHGGLTALGLALAATLVSYVLGTTIGLVAGYRKDLLAGFLMRGIDVLMAFPPLLFALVLITGAGTSSLVVVIAVGVIQVPGIARLVRSVTLDLSVRGFVEAAATRAERMSSILRREILPNITAPLLADFGLRFSYGIVLIASLNFLGVGLAPPAADWGLMIAENRGIISFNIWAVLVPALFLAVVTAAINLIADSYITIQGRSGTRSAAK